MRIALYSDIHSNQEALEAVLEDLQKRNIDRRVCLGDIVGYGASPNECAQLVQSDAAVTIAGNHDFAAIGRIPLSNFNAFASTAMEWTKAFLSAESREFLTGLPLVGALPQARIVHATPDEPEKWAYVRTLSDAAERFAFFTEAFCFVGHTHVPSIVLEQGQGKPLVCSEPYCALAPGERGFVNVGSVGQPRDRDPRACYVIYETETRSIQYCRIPYDIVKAQDKMRRAGLPSFLIQRLEQGR